MSHTGLLEGYRGDRDRKEAEQIAIQIHKEVGPPNLEFGCIDTRFVVEKSK